MAGDDTGGGGAVNAGFLLAVRLWLAPTGFVPFLARLMLGKRTFLPRTSAGARRWFCFSTRKPK
jgi:hypothetical protein